MLSFAPTFFTLLAKGYTKAGIRADAMAGLTVAIVALPLAMALAIASGASPEKGLVTAVIAGFLISFLGGSRVQIGGPTGAFVVVVYGIISQFGYDGLIMATLLAGVILVIAGYAKFGQLLKFIPHPVITGFTAGIAVIIASSQIRDFFGLTLQDVPADFFLQWKAYFNAWQSFNGVTLAIGALALTTILLIRKHAPKLPAYLITIALCAVLVTLFGLPVETIGSRFPNLPSGLPMPSLPVWNFEKFQEIIPAAFTIAFLAGIEALLSAVVADGMTGYKHNSNQELMGQGIANIASALFGGLPATGAIARTATNIKAGGTSPLAGIFHAIFLLLFMYFAMDVMAFVPMAALAAILFVVAWGMSELKNFIHIFKISNSDRLLLLLTFVLTVCVDLIVAISVGVILASFLFMHHMSNSVEMYNNATDDEETDADADESDQRLKLPQGVEVFQINGPVFFGIASDLLETLKAMGQMPKVLILRMRFVPYLDASGEAMVEGIIKQCQPHGTQLIFSAVQAQPAKILRRGGITEKTGVHFEPRYSAALKAAKAMLENEVEAK